VGIRDTLVYLQALQETIEITEPRAMRVIRAYHTIPAEASELPDTPCFINTWTLLPLIRMPGLLETEYDIHMQLAILDADQSYAAEIAGAFMDAIIAKFNTNLTLGGTISHHDLTGGSPTLVNITWGKTFVGLDLHLHVYIKEPINFS